MDAASQGFLLRLEGDSQAPPSPRTEGLSYATDIPREQAGAAIATKNVTARWRRFELRDGLY